MAGQGGVVRCHNCKTVPRADTIAVPVHTCTAGFPRLRIFSTVFDTCLYLQRDGPHAPRAPTAPTAPCPTAPCPTAPAHV